MTDGYKDVPLKASLFAEQYDTGWSATGKYTYSGTTTGLSVSNKPGSSEWANYLMFGYVKLATNPTTVNNRAGFVIRYQDVNNYYFVGFATDTTNGGLTDSTYEVWKKEGGSYSRIANNYDTGNNDEGSSDYGLPETVGSSGVLSPDTEYHLRVEVSGTVCRVLLQNVLIFENLTDFSTFIKGKPGFEAWTTGSADILASFDSVRVVT